jgi:hypothetical protein
VQSISSFPINTEIKTVKTYSTTPNLNFFESNTQTVNLPSALDSGVLTVELNTSMIAFTKGSNAKEHLTLV